jgi:hypothetical protein
LPLIIVCFTLILLLKLTNNEALAGLTSILMLVPYYLILWLLRRVIKKNFKFRLVKG